MALQLQTIYDEFEDEKKDISDVSLDLFYRWMTRIADFLYDQKRSVDPNRFISSQAFTISSDPQASTLPNNFLGMQEIGTGVFRVDSNGKDTDDELSVSHFGSRISGYYLDGETSIVFTGISDGGQYKLRYMPTGPSFSSLSDYFTLDKTSGGTKFMADTKLEYIIRALDVLYSIWDEEKGDESYADQRFVRELERVLDKDRRNPLAISIPDHSNYF